MVRYKKNLQCVRTEPLVDKKSFFCFFYCHYYHHHCFILFFFRGRDRNHSVRKLKTSLLFSLLYTHVLYSNPVPCGSLLIFSIKVIGHEAV